MTPTLPKLARDNGASPDLIASMFAEVSVRRPV
jgi:hypothetical protein